MLLPTQWATRIGVNPSLAEGGGDEGVQAIKTLTLWRFLPDATRGSWESGVTSKLHGAGRATGTAGDFWREVYGKKVGLFGSGATYASVDPTQAYRHPWCLKRGEFVLAMQSIELEMPPSSVPDDRVRITSLLSKVGMAVGFGTQGAAAIGVAVTPVVGQVAAAIGVAGMVGGGAEWGYDKLEGDRFSKQLPALKSVYEQEARYRELEVR